jgi:hypothetical protein
MRQDQITQLTHGPLPPGIVNTPGQPAGSPQDAHQPVLRQNPPQENGQIVDIITHKDTCEG